MEPPFPNQKIDFGVQRVSLQMRLSHSRLRRPHRVIVEIGGSFALLSPATFVWCVVDNADNGLIRVLVVHLNTLKRLLVQALILAVMIQGTSSQRLDSLLNSYRLVVGFRIRIFSLKVSGSNTMIDNLLG